MCRAQSLMCAPADENRALAPENVESQSKAGGQLPGRAGAVRRPLVGAVQA